MEDLTPIRTEWRKAKARAQQMCIKAGREDVAKQIRVCTMFSGTETLEELCDLLFKPQAQEFMSRFEFPSLSVFRQFKKYDTQQYGVYIDAGDIVLEDVSRVLLVGRTRATLKYFKAQQNDIICLRGATALVEASGYSVVHVELDKQSKAREIVKDHAYVR